MNTPTGKINASDVMDWYGTLNTVLNIGNWQNSSGTVISTISSTVSSGQ